MSLTPITDAGLVIQIHIVAAVLAMALGVAQFAGIKGTVAHRVMGYSWVGLMAVVAVSSFWIFEYGIIGPFSPIHLLSIYVLIMLPLAVRHARRGRIGDHRSAMVWMFIGALIVAGLFTFLPGRIMHSVVFGG